jgi:hypothetical protein
MLRSNQAPAGRSKKVGTQDESSMQHPEAAAVPCNATRPNIAVLHGWGWAANLYDTTAVYIRASVVLCLTTYRVWVHIPYSTFVMNSLHLPHQVLCSNMQLPCQPRPAGCQGCCYSLAACCYCCCWVLGRQLGTQRGHHQAARRRQHKQQGQQVYTVCWWLGWLFMLTSGELYMLIECISVC